MANSVKQRVDEADVQNCVRFKNNIENSILLHKNSKLFILIATKYAIQHTHSFSG